MMDYSKLSNQNQHGILSRNEQEVQKKKNNNQQKRQTKISGPQLSSSSSSSQSSPSASSSSQSSSPSSESGCATAASSFHSSSSPTTIATSASLDQQPHQRTLGNTAAAGEKQQKDKRREVEVASKDPPAGASGSSSSTSVPCVNCPSPSSQASSTTTHYNHRHNTNNHGNDTRMTLITITGCNSSRDKEDQNSQERSETTSGDQTIEHRVRQQQALKSDRENIHLLSEDDEDECSDSNSETFGHQDEDYEDDHESSVVEITEDQIKNHVTKLHVTQDNPFSSSHVNKSQQPSSSSSSSSEYNNRSSNNGHLNQNSSSRPNRHNTNNHNATTHLQVRRGSEPTLNQLTVPESITLSNHHSHHQQPKNHSKQHQQQQQPHHNASGGVKSSSIMSQKHQMRNNDSTTGPSGFGSKKDDRMTDDHQYIDSDNDDDDDATEGTNAGYNNKKKSDGSNPKSSDGNHHVMINSSNNNKNSSNIIINHHQHPKRWSTAATTAASSLDPIVSTAATSVSTTGAAKSNQPHHHNQNKSSNNNRTSGMVRKGSTDDYDSSDDCNNGTLDHHHHNNRHNDQQVSSTATSVSSYSASSPMSLPSPVVIYSVKSGTGPLGIHVVPYNDPLRDGEESGLQIEKIEPGGRIDRDGRFKIDDIIIEVNGTSLTNIDFVGAQEIFKEALRSSPDHIILKVRRDFFNYNSSNHDPVKRETITSSTPVVTSAGGRVLKSSSSDSVIKSSSGGVVSSKEPSSHSTSTLPKNTTHYNQHETKYNGTMNNKLTDDSQHEDDVLSDDEKEHQQKTSSKTTIMMMDTKEVTTPTSGSLDTSSEPSSASSSVPLFISSPSSSTSVSTVVNMNISNNSCGNNNSTTNSCRLGSSPSAKKSSTPPTVLPKPSPSKIKLATLTNTNSTGAANAYVVTSFHHPDVPQTINDKIMTATINPNEVLRENHVLLNEENSDINCVMSETPIITQQHQTSSGSTLRSSNRGIMKMGISSELRSSSSGRGTSSSSASTEISKKMMMMNFGGSGGKGRSAFPSLGSSARGRKGQSSTGGSGSAKNPSIGSGAVLAVAANTRKIGKKYHIRLTKGPCGLGFSITTRDNPAGGNCPIYIKNILPKGSAIMDGRLKQGDRLLEVNGIQMTGKSQEEAVDILKNLPVASQVDLIISRQESVIQNSHYNSSSPTPSSDIQLPSPKLPRQIPPEKSDYSPQDDMIIQNDDPVVPSSQVSSASSKQREVLTFEIPLNDTGSAGLGVSVKGRTQVQLVQHDNTDGTNGAAGGSDDDDSQEKITIDMGIFVKAVIHGGAVSKDGRLKPNDQLLSINGIPLLGLTNADAMERLRRAMLEIDGQTCITLTVARRVNLNQSSNSNTEGNTSQQQSSSGTTKISFHHSAQSSMDADAEGTTPSTAVLTFQRDGFGRQSMSEKRHAHLDAKMTETYQRNKKLKDKNIRNHIRSHSLEVHRNFSASSHVPSSSPYDNHLRHHDLNDPNLYTTSPVTHVKQPHVTTSTLMSSLTVGPASTSMSSSSAGVMSSSSIHANHQHDSSLGTLESTPPRIVETFYGHYGSRQQQEPSTSASGKKPSFFTPDCCWSCGSPGGPSCPYHPQASATVVRRERNHPHNASSSSSHHRISRVTNESFRAAVDKSYDEDESGTGVNFSPDHVPSGDANQYHHQHQSRYGQSSSSVPGATGISSSGAASVSSSDHHMMHRPSVAAGLSLGSQMTTGTATTTNTTSTTDDDMIGLFKNKKHHTPGINLNQVNSPESGGQDDSGEYSLSPNTSGTVTKKKGIFKKLLKFGSKRGSKSSSSAAKNKGPPTVQELMQELEADAERIRAKRSAQIENERIQEHYRRLKSEHEKHQQQEQRMQQLLQQQQRQQQQQQQMRQQQMNGVNQIQLSTSDSNGQILMSDDPSDEMTQYEQHYMNLQQIQQMRQKRQVQIIHQQQQQIPSNNGRGALTVVSNRPMVPIPNSSSTPIPPGVTASSITQQNSQAIVAFSNRPIPMRQVPIPPVPPGRPQPTYMTSKQAQAALMQHQQQQQQHQRRQQQMISNQNQGVPTGAALQQMSMNMRHHHQLSAGGIYGMIGNNQNSSSSVGPSPHPDSIQNQNHHMMFRRQLSNHRIVPVAGGHVTPTIISSTSGGYIQSSSGSHPQQSSSSNMNSGQNVYLYSSLPPTVNLTSAANGHQHQMQQQPIYGQYYGTIGSRHPQQQQQLSSTSVVPQIRITHHQQQQHSTNHSGPLHLTQQQAIYYSTINGSDV